MVSWLFDIGCGRGLPYDLREGIALNESSFYVLEDGWSAKGAQEFPFGMVILNETILANAIEDASVVYIGGSAGAQLVCFLSP